MNVKAKRRGALQNVDKKWGLVLYSGQVILGEGVVTKGKQNYEPYSKLGLTIQEKKKSNTKNSTNYFSIHHSFKHNYKFVLSLECLFSRDAKLGANASIRACGTLLQISETFAVKYTAQVQNGTNNEIVSHGQANYKFQKRRIN